MSGIVVLLLAEIGDREIGKEVYKASLCLRDQRIAVCQEENVLDPPVLQQYLDEGDNSARFARAGGRRFFLSKLSQTAFIAASW